MKNGVKIKSAKGKAALREGKGFLMMSSVHLDPAMPENDHSLDFYLTESIIPWGILCHL